MTIDPSKTAEPEIRVGPWRVDRTLNEVTAPGGERVRLEPKAIEVLAYLAARPGVVVGREELLSAVWPGVVVGDDALTQAIIKLRKALGDDAHQPRYIETISKRGYRLIAPVTAPGIAAPAEPAGRRIRRRLLWTSGALVGAVAAAAGISLATGKWPRMPWPIAADVRGAPAAALPIVAVLPLANLSGDSKREYFSDGITEDIIAGLGRFSGLRVMSANAVQAFKGRPHAPNDIRDALGVRYIVHGSVREADGRLRVAVSLSDADKGLQLWSERIEDEGGKVFEMQDRIVRSIVGALHVNFTQAERDRMLGKPTESLEAYDLVVQARSLTYRMTRETNRQARELLARAIQLSPDYGEAHVTLAHAEYRRADQGWMEHPEEGMRRVEAHARRALELRDAGAHARAHAQLARVHMPARNDDQALAEASRAVELNPSDAVALYALGSVLVWTGRAQEAIPALESASRFDPSFDNLMLPMAYYVLARYDEALRWSEARIARHPETVFLHAVRTAALVELGREGDAYAAAAEVRRLSPFAKAERFATNFRHAEHSARFQGSLRKAGL